MSGPGSPANEAIATSPALLACRITASNAGDFGAVEAAGQDAVDICVPAKYRGKVAVAFGVPDSPKATVATTLAEPIVVVQYTKYPTPMTDLPTSRFFSPQVFTAKDDAQCRLALPNGNPARYLAFYRIPAGTTVLVGRTADMSAHDEFRKNAKGDADQIYWSFDATIPDRIL